MTENTNYYSWNYVYLMTGLIVIGSTSFLFRRSRTKKRRVCGVDYPTDTVILHQFERGKTAPSIGHFVMKLETFLRANKIPYQSNYDFRNGPKGKVPWIEYNDVTMGDSHLIIAFLSKEFKLDTDSHLTGNERAHAWAIQKWIEEYMYWLNVHTRWVIFTDEMFTEGISSLPKALKYVIRKKATDLTYKVGVGRHSNTEIHEFMLHDLRQFSEILGEKKYIMGDSISMVDFSAFGILSQIRWCTPSKCPGSSLLKSAELSNVACYLDRIKELYWPDWSDPQVEINKT